VNRNPQPWSALRRAWRRLESSKGSELVEFAVCLPLLVVLVVGTYDFGGAFTLKQKLNSAAAEGARVASSQGTTDLSVNGTCGAPASICVVRDVVDSYLTRSNVNDCGLAAATGSSAGTLAWSFDSSCGGTLHLQIQRGLTYTSTLATPFDTGTYRIEATKVTLVYPYQWQFSRVITLLVPSANYTGSQITVSAVMQNIN
jgi:Flp pilus assembly protein TadG